jgi:hypothetical protein
MDFIWELLVLATVLLYFQANGELYYFASLLVFGVIAYSKPRVCVSIYENAGPILGGLNLLAFLLCLFLLVKAKLKTTEEDPYLQAEVRTQVAPPHNP